MDLEDAIRTHVNNERKDIHPANHTTVPHRAELHIKIFENAPRNSRILRTLLEKKKSELRHASTVHKHEDLYTEVQACERLLGMVTAHEAGRSLEGLAY